MGSMKFEKIMISRVAEKSLEVSIGFSWETSGFPLPVSEVVAQPVVNIINWKKRVLSISKTFRRSQRLKKQFFFNKVAYSFMRVYATDVHGFFVTVTNSAPVFINSIDHKAVEVIH